MKNTMQNKPFAVVSPSTRQPAGWDDEVLEVGMVFKATSYLEGEENPLNTLYADNRGRFFLAQTDYNQTNPMDMPGTAFHEISFKQALEWAIHAQNNYESAEGDTVELLKYALKLLAKNKS